MNQSLKYLFILIALSATGTLNAQFNNVKIDVLRSVFNRDLSLAYERTFNNIGVQLHGTYGNEPIVYVFERDPMNSFIILSSETFKRRIGIIRLDVRYYFANYKAMPGTGFYAGVLGHWEQKGRAEPLYYETAQAHTGVIPEIGSTQAGQGITTGYKWVIKDKIILEANIDTRVQVSNSVFRSRLSFNSGLYAMAGYRF